MPQFSYEKGQGCNFVGGYYRRLVGGKVPTFFTEDGVEKERYTEAGQGIIVALRGGGNHNEPLEYAIRQTKPSEAAADGSEDFWVTEADIALAWKVIKDGEEGNKEGN